MKKQLYFSVRTVHGTDTENAIEQVEDQEFDESHDLCDKVLTTEELLKELTLKTKYAVLTDEEGSICGVISYEKIEEMREKTLKLIEEFTGKTVSHYLSPIILHSTFQAVLKENSKQTAFDFYLTATDIK